MPVFRESFKIETRGNAQVVDVTGEVSQSVLRTGLRAGTVTVFVPGATGSVTTIEFEPGLVDDIDELFERVAPAARVAMSAMRTCLRLPRCRGMPALPSHPSENRARRIITLDRKNAIANICER